MNHFEFLVYGQTLTRPGCALLAAGSQELVNQFISPEDGAGCIYSASGGSRPAHSGEYPRPRTVSVSRPVLRWSSVTRTALSLCDRGSGVWSDDQWEQQDHRMGACLLSGLWPGESGGSVGQRRAQSVSLICLFATMTPHSTVLRRAVMCYYPQPPAPPLHSSPAHPRQP